MTTIETARPSIGRLTAATEAAAGRRRHSSSAGPLARPTLIRRWVIDRPSGLVAVWSQA